MNLINKNLKSPLLAFIKSEPTFLTGSLAVCLSAPPSQFRSDIFKQTPPSFTFSEIERCCLGALRRG